MKEWYDVKTHLTVAHAHTEGLKSVVEDASVQLCVLGMWMLMGDATIHRLKVLADGVEYYFEGKIVTEDYHRIVEAVRNAKSVDIAAEYDFKKLAFTELNPGPFSLAEDLEYLKDKGKIQLCDLLFSMYSYRDCGDYKERTAVAYGEKDGVVYAGEIPSRKTEVLPDGAWHIPCVYLYGCDAAEEEDPAAFEALMNVFAQFGKISYDTDYGKLHIGNVNLTGDTDFRVFADVVSEMMTLSGEDDALWGCDVNNLNSVLLMDSQSADIRFARVAFSADGSYTILLYEV